MVLIVVIGVLAVLSLIAATFGMLMSVELAASRNQTEYEMARQAAHAGAEQLLADLAASMPVGGITVGPTQSTFCPLYDPITNAYPAELGCRQLYARDGVKVYYLLHNHPPVTDPATTGSLPWKSGLGSEDSGMFNINAMGFANDLGSNSDHTIRYTSFETSLVRLLRSRFDAVPANPDPPVNDVDEIRGAGFPAFHGATTAAENERQRIAILLAKAIISWRHGGDRLPGNDWVEERRLGHLPRWSPTLGCTAADGRLGVAYPADTDTNYEWGWTAADTDALASMLIKRTTDPADPANPWNYAEPNIWRTNTGGLWNDDIGVSPSGITWGRISSVGAGPPYLVAMDNTVPGWHDWPADRWLATAAPFYYLHIPTGAAKGWYQIGDGVDPDTIAGQGPNWIELTAAPPVDPSIGDPFCIVRGGPVVGAGMDSRWDSTTAGAIGDLIPTAFAWPDGTLTTENAVFDLVKETGIVGIAENQPNPYLTDSNALKGWTPGEWTNYVVHILDGPAAGQVRQILDNTSNSLELATPWYSVDTEVRIPTIGARYAIEYAEKDLPSKYRPDYLQGDDRLYLSLGDLRDSIIVPALQEDDDTGGADMGTAKAQSMADLIMPYFLPYLTVSSNALKASQVLGGINDWAVDGLDNDADGVADDNDEAQDSRIVAKALYEKLGLKAWAYGRPDPDTARRQAAQLVANIIDYRDGDHVPLRLTETDLGETVPFTVYGAEGLHVTEVMASPDAVFASAGTEMTDDGVGDPLVDEDEQGWDWDDGAQTPPNCFRMTDVSGVAGHFEWLVPAGARGHFAIRLIGNEQTFTFIYNGVPYTVTPSAANPDPEGGGWYYAFVRDAAGKLLSVSPDAADKLVFDLMAGQGARLHGFALLPQYIEITNIAANDVLVDGVTVRTDAGSISLSGMTDPWLQLIRGASADGTYPISYGTYVIAMSEQAYSNQWKADTDSTWGNEAGENGTWGDRPVENYPVYFAGDVNDTLAKALMMGLYKGAGTERVWAVSVETEPIPGTPILIAGGAVDAAQGVITSPQEAYSSVEKNAILQPTWDTTTPNPFWTSHQAAPVALSGSQNTLVTVEADAPRTPPSNIQISSTLNKQYSHIWKNGSATNYPTLATGSYLADFSRNHAFPIIRNQPYPTVGWLGLVPTSNNPWRTVDPISGGLVQNAGNSPAFLQTYRRWPANPLDPDYPVGRQIRIYAGAGKGAPNPTVTAVNATDDTILDLSQDWPAGNIPDNTSRYVFLNPNRPEELLGTLIAKASTGGVYARFNINTAPIDTLKAVFEDGQAALISNTRENELAAKSWANWDELLNDPIFRYASNDFASPTHLGYFDDAPTLGVANEDSGAGLIADDFMDDADEKEEWARRYANLFDLRSTAFRFIVSGLVFTETATQITPPIATARIEMDVDLSDSDAGPRIVHFRYLSQ